MALPVAARCLPAATPPFAFGRGLFSSAILLSERSVMPNPPLMVEVTRGTLVESRHRCIAAVAGPDGGVVKSWGDIEQPIYGRSAIKPLLALPLVETGAADAFGLGDAEIALAC